MFFSDRNENTVYINHFSGLLEVEGTGELEAGDAVVTPKSRDSWADEYDTLSIKEKITEIREGYLENFRNIKCLILSRSVTGIALSSADAQMLQRNKVLIRGEYNTFAEEFSRRMSLAFLHSDIFLAEVSDESEMAFSSVSTKSVSSVWDITLKFSPKSVNIKDERPN